MENKNLQAKLKAFALILKISNDLFSAKDFANCAAMAVSNGRVLLNFRNSSIIEMENNSAKVIAQYGLEQVNTHSKLAQLQCSLLEKINLKDNITILTKEQLGKDFDDENIKYLCIKLVAPKNLEQNDLKFFWLLEYIGEISTYAKNTACLLGTSIANALYFQRLCKKNSWKYHAKHRKKWVLIVILILLIAAMFIPTPTRATAEFTIKSPITSHVYAWINGQLKSCYSNDGDIVKKGDLIVEYDTDQLMYQYDIAKASYQELLSELELERKNSFTDQDKLGVVKLLEAKLKTTEFSVAESKWKLEKSKIYAPNDGIISFSQENKDTLNGKVVTTGEEIFSVFSGDGMEGEILLNERDASLLNDDLDINLFLYTSPEKAIKAEIISISSYPKLSLQNSYCYVINIKLPRELTNLRYGMRGIAQISGEKSPLGYNLFKDIILYFRGI